MTGVVPSSSPCPPGSLPCARQDEDAGGKLGTICPTGVGVSDAELFF